MLDPPPDQEPSDKSSDKRGSQQGPRKPIEGLTVERFYAVLEWIRDPNNLTAISTFVIAAFTIVLAGVGYCQSRLFRKSIDLARQEFTATHRPRIVVRFIQGPLHDENGFEFVRVTLVNKGETGGTIVAIGRDLARRKGRGGWLPPGLAADMKPVMPITLISGEQFVIDAKAQSPTGDKEIFAEAMDNSELCAVGCIQYRDGNGRLLETGFLRIHDGQGNFLPSDNPEDEYQD